MAHRIHGRRSASDKWPPSLPDQQETLVDKTFVFGADELIASTLVGRGSLLHKPGRLVTLKTRSITSKSSDSDENTHAEAAGGIRVVSTPGRFFGERDWTRSTVKRKQDHASLDADFDDHSGHNHRERHRHRQVKKWLEDDEPRDDVPRRAKPGRRSLGHGRPVIGRVGDVDMRPRAPSGGSRYASSGTQTAGGSASPPAGDRPVLPGQTGGEKPGRTGSGSPSTGSPTTAPTSGSVQTPSGVSPPVTVVDPRLANPPAGPVAPGTIAGPAVPAVKPDVPIQSGPGLQQPAHTGGSATLPAAPPASSGQNVPPPASVPDGPAVQQPVRAGDVAPPPVSPPASSQPKVLPPTSTPAGPVVAPITNPATTAPGFPSPPQQLIPLKDQYMLAATGQTTQIRSATPGISAGTVPSDHIVFSTPDTGTQAFLTSSGPIVFETSLEEIKKNISEFPLSRSDPLRRDFNAAWKLDENASYLQSADVNLKLGSDGKSLEMTGLKVKVSKDTSAPLVFSTDAKVLNDEFETGFFHGSKDAKITTLTGIDRYPGHLLLGLETGSANGGFKDLTDLCAVAHINPKPWLKILLKETAITFGALAGTPARNAMWYIPGSGSKCCFRLEASLNLGGKLAGLLNKYLAGWNDHIPPLSVIAKRTVAPSSGPWGDASTIGELTIAAEPDINGEKRAMGMYVTIGEDHINVFFVCYSKALQWEALKAWIRKSCSEVGTAIDDLEKVLLNTGHGSKTQNTSTSHIYWRKVTVTLLNDGKGGLSLAGMRLELEASMQVLVPKDKHSVFTLDFIWTKGTGEFSGECEFSGVGNVLGKGDPPLQYYLDYERWDQFSYLDPSEPFMSLRYLDSSFVQNLPFGIPTEITEADLYVSNKSLSISGRLEALIGRPTETSVVSDPSKIPSLQIAHTMLGFSVDYTYVSKEFNIMLDGSVSLVPFKEGDPPPSLEAMVMYSSQESQVSFSANASHIPMTALHSLFAAGEEKTHAMSILERIELQRIALEITASKGQPARIIFEADLKIASVLLETKFSRTDANTWSLTAELHKENTPAGKASKQFTLGEAVQKLLGQEVLDILPGFVTGTTFKASEPGKDKFDIVVTRLNGAKSHLVLGAELKFGMLHVQFAQLVPITGKADKPSPTKRLIRVSLGPLPSISKLPILGNLDIPFDALEFLWVSTMFTPEDISTLNGSAKMFQEQPFKMRSEDKELSEGFHFRLVGSQGVFLDHVFGQDKKEEKKTPAGTVAPGSKATPAPVQEKKPSTEAVVPGGGGPATTAALAKKKGPLTLSGISLSYKDGVLRIHLDASVLIGPISAGIQGLNLVVRLKSDEIRGLHDILHVPIDVEVEGFDMSFTRMPIQIAGALHHKPGTKAYFGGVAISLSTFSIAALGSYEQVPANAAAGTPEYDSFFIYAMMEGLIFTMGWAEVRGLMAGFGYNSRLRLPNVEQLSKFPLIQGFEKEGGFNMNQAIQSLTGPDAFVTPSMGSIWLALGLVIRACEAIDMRAVATVALGPNQTDIGLIARATATLPRRASPDKALVLIDLSVVGKLDLVNGELSVDGLINPTSFILNKDCRPSGGFAIRSWFGKNNPHSGDWVVSFGGYHPMYQVPAHYPRPQRLGISWTLSSNLRVTGNAYAAITPGAIMAGGMLQAVFSAGPLGAHFDAHADFLVNLKPLYYVADMAVSAGVYYEIRVWRFRKKISVNVGASLHLEGPPIHGKVHFDLSVVSFTVSFGSGTSEGKKAISLRELMDLVLQEAGDTRRKEDNVILNPHTFTAVSGLLGDDKKKSDTVNKAPPNKVTAEKERWHVRSDNFIFSVRSAVPTNSIGIEGRGASQYTGNSIISRPMQMKKDTGDSSKIKSTLSVRVQNKEGDKIVPFREVAKVEDKLPANYWGPYSENTADYMRPDRMPPTVSHLVGATLVPPPPAAPEQSIPVFKSMPETYPASKWEPKKLEKRVRYLDHANARDSVKWSRVKGAMGLEPEAKREKPPMDPILLTETGAAKLAAATKPPLTKPYRQGILDSFISLAHGGEDEESRKVQKAYKGIGDNVPDVILNDPQRFYIGPPTVFCN
ncbi:transcriptional activator srcap [Fusarium mexicanum]|uniref:Transcriptional activator srcap n=1 Tax=Fusarium mexicanum TaxID=751941 RepID=A0A8H5JHB0_9HYPO|nr:transcriptional activator srcap [Fusarium mexicanum]